MRDAVIKSSISKVIRLGVLVLLAGSQFSDSAWAIGGRRRASAGAQRPSSNSSSVPNSSSRPVLRLIPANHRGNPGFQTKIEFTSANGEAKTWDCQATLVHREGDECLAATAAHCLIADTGKEKTDTKLQALTNEISIDTHDFGKVRARTYTDPRFIVDGWTKPYDNGALHFTCPEGRDVPIVRVSEEAVGEKERVYYGKIMQNPGLWQGSASPLKIDDAQRAILVEVAGNMASDYGDSGGGMYRKVGEEFELIGLHSGVLQYSTDLEFIKRIIAHLFD